MSSDDPFDEYSRLRPLIEVNPRRAITQFIIADSFREMIIWGAVEGALILAVGLSVVGLRQIPVLMIVVLLVGIGVSIPIVVRFCRAFSRGLRRGLGTLRLAKTLGKNVPLTAENVDWVIRAQIHAENR